MHIKQNTNNIHMCITLLLTTTTARRRRHSVRGVQGRPPRPRSLFFKSDVCILSHPRGSQIAGSSMENYVLRKGTRVGQDTEIPVHFLCGTDKRAAQGMSPSLHHALGTRWKRRAGCQWEPLV